MAAGKLASAAVKGISNIIRDIKPKPATTSGKQARRRMNIEDTPKTKIAKRRNVKRDPKTGRLSTEGNKEQQIVVQQPKSKQQLKTVATERGTGKLGKTALAAEKRVKARERRRAATQAGATVAGLASIPVLTKDKKSATASESKSKSSSKSYKVKKGDTLSEIARDNGTTLKKLKAANPQIKDLNKIKPGQAIKIPMPKVKDRKSVYQGISKSEMKKISMPKKKYGGKIYKRKEGGQVMSGNDLVSSLYN
jgi:LysM repeat protein